MIELNNGQNIPVQQISAWHLLPLAIFCCYLSWQFLQRNHASREKIFMTTAAISYGFLLLAITQFPLNRLLTPRPQFWGQQSGIITLNPLRTFSYGNYQIVANLIMLTPLSFFYAYFTKKGQSWWANAKFCVLISVTIECSQLLLNYFYLSSRCFDTGDILVNSLGATAGWLAYQAYCHIKELGFFKKYA